MNDYLTPADVAALLKVSVRTVGRWIASGDLAAVRAGAVVRVSRQALTDWERSHGTAGNRTEADASAPATHVVARRPVALPVGNLPAEYRPVFPELWQTGSASPADGRTRGTQRKEKRG